MFRADIVRAEGIMHATSVAGKYSFFRLSKKLLVPLANQIFFDEILQSKEHHLVYSGNAATTGGQVAVNESCSLWILTAVVGFVKVNVMKWIFHGSMINSPDFQIRT